MLQSSTPIAQPLRGEQRAAARVALGRALLADAAPLRFVVGGASMWPALRRGDVVEVEAASVASLRVGDVAVFRQGAVLLAHRVIELLNPPEGPRLLRLRGDTRRAAEGPLGEGELLGRIRQRERRGRTRRLDRGLSRAWGKAMLQVGGLWAWSFDLYRAWRRTHARAGRSLVSAIVLIGSLLAGARTHAADRGLPHHSGPLDVIEMLRFVQWERLTTVPRLLRAARRRLGSTPDQRTKMLAQLLGANAKGEAPPPGRGYQIALIGGTVVLILGPPSPTPIRSIADLFDKTYVIGSGSLADTVHVGRDRWEHGRLGPNTISMVVKPGPRGDIRVVEYLARPSPGARRSNNAARNLRRDYTLFRGVVEH